MTLRVCSSSPILEITVKMSETLDLTQAIQAALRKKGAPVVKKAGRRHKSQKAPRSANYASRAINKAFSMKFDSGAAAGIFLFL